MNIYILLQGLFFFEYKSNPSCLYVTTPVVKGTVSTRHDYRYGNPEDKGKLKQIDMHKVFDWRKDLKGNPDYKSFPSLLQFSKTEAKTGNITDNCSEFAFRLILPRPWMIYPLRKGNRSDFRPNVSKYVWKSINNHSDLSFIPLMTCLEYQGNYEPSGSGTNRCHIYAESDCAEDVADANRAYGQCGKPFFTGGFDFRLDESFGTPPPVKAKAPAADDGRLTDLRRRDKADEYGLSEFFAKAKRIGCPRHPIVSVNVANCGQFGVLP
jgi:hypothetical protein